MARSELKLNRDLAKTAEMLMQESRAFSNDAKRVLVDVANDIRNDIIRRMARTPKRGRQYKRGRKIHIASSPWQYPAVDRAELLRAIIYDTGRRHVEIGAEAGAGYADYLEEGTRFMKPRHWLGRSVNRITRMPGKGLEDRMARLVEESMTRGFKK